LNQSNSNWSSSNTTEFFYEWFLSIHLVHLLKPVKLQANAGPSV
jgi:hypothetical protein